MRKGMMVALCLAFALSGHGHMEKGRLTIEPHVGMTIANVIGSGSMGSTAQVGFMGGAELQYGISERLSLSAGINYAQYGARDHGEHYMEVSGTGNYVYHDNHLDCHIDYLTIPLSVAFHPCHGLSLNAGVQLGVRTKATLKGMSKQYCSPNPNTLNGVWKTYDGMDIGDQLRTMDMGIPIGIGYEYKNVTLDARYLFGLLNVSKMKGVPLRNSAFMFTLGYKIPLRKR